MSVPIEGLPRRVIPRWRDFRTAAALGEISSFQSVAVHDEIRTGLGSLATLWKSHRSEVIAGELLSASWLEGAWDVAAEAARYLLRRGSAARELTKNFAQNIIEDLEGASAPKPSESISPLNQNAIRSIRSALRLYPHDALGWCELSRYYSIIGKQEKARRAIRTAISLAPESRYILRSASRCLIHLGDVEAALDVLNRATRTSIDPWLLAAHVSIGNILARPPRFYKRAKEVIKSASLPPFHTAELNAALGTVELFAGNDKGARKMLMASLEDPTENVIAQAWWAKSKLKIVVKPDLLDLPRSFEANTRALVLTENWQGATQAAEKWLEDEPFSSNPAIELSFILSVAFDEHDRARAFLEHARRANPDDLLVANNLAFALVHLGRLQEARDILTAANVENAVASKLVALTATSGLLHFREGNIEEGRRLYESAIQLARKNQLQRQAALATIYLAKEENRVNTPEAIAARAEADHLGAIYKDPVFQLVLRTLHGPLTRTDVAPSTTSLRRPDSRLV